MSPGERAGRGAKVRDAGLGLRHIRTGFRGFGGFRFRGACASCGHMRLHLCWELGFTCMWAGLWLGVYAYCTPKRQGTNATSTRGVATHADTVTHSLAQDSARVETGLSATLRRLISSQSQDRCKSFSTKTRDKQGFKPRRAAGARQVRAYTPTPCASAVSRVPRGHASDTPAPRLRGGRVDPLRWRRAVGCGGAWSGSGRRPCVGRRHKSSASGSSASP